jgi:glycerol-3-phosphate dehydrogenase (NAD(P)+)
MNEKACVLGSGAMGIACAFLLAEHPGQNVTLWGRDPQHVSSLRSARENVRQLPGILIPESIDVTSDIVRAVADANLLVVAVPSAYLRNALSQLANRLPRDIAAVSAVKGMENSTLKLPSEIISEILGHDRVAVLSGPSHAEEICRRLPASVVAAHPDLELAQWIQCRFATDRFRVYANVDRFGVELAGALKNVVAIAAGICDGLNFGDNAKSALITRAIVEMTRFGTQLGAESATFSGLAGLGDLITTCFSPYGRNRKVGERIGRGETLAEIQSSMQSVAEGIPTSRSVYELACKLGAEMPITSEVFHILFENKPPLEAAMNLMMRPSKIE